MDSKRVREFSEQTNEETILPNTPTAMSKDQVYFLIKMMIDELLEFGATVSDSNDVKINMIDFVINGKQLNQENYPENEEYPDLDKIESQSDALIDCYYYSQNAATKHGINLSALFNVVHNANMAKKDPQTNKFLKREDGKVIKPSGWLPPDLKSELMKHFKHGSF